MSELALLGGSPAVPRQMRKVEWPVVTPEDEAAVKRVLDSRKFTCVASGEQEVKGFEEEWAQFLGAKHCVAVSNGTAAIQLAIAALGVGPGDEVLVPALSFIATAVAPVHQLAIPVFVDIDPVSFNMDVNDLAAKITDRTRAIVVVHLHGLPANMDEIMDLARRHNLFVVEDAAQAHGAMYRGRHVGTIGDIATFSLNVSKNLPTCGEGGMITTNSTELFEKVLMLRQFGEIIKDGEERSYIHHILGYNNKLSSIQAAFTRSQLTRYSEAQAKREENVTRMLNALAGVKGLICPSVPEDRTHEWHILRFRFDPVAAGLETIAPGPFRKALQKVLRAEGLPLSEYQKMPLSGHKLFQTQEGFGKGYPWAISDKKYDYRIEDTPVTMQVIESSLTIQRMHLNPESGPLLDHYAEAFLKVFENLDFVADVARSIAYEPPWHSLVPEPAR